MLGPKMFQLEEIKEAMEEYISFCSHILRLAEAIENGEWQVNGETIKIDEKGNIKDGQPRRKYRFRSRAKAEDAYTKAQQQAHQLYQAMLCYAMGSEFITLRVGDWKLDLFLYHAISKQELACPSACLWDEHSSRFPQTPYFIEDVEDWIYEEKNKVLTSSDQSLHDLRTLADNAQRTIYYKNRE